MKKSTLVSATLGSVLMSAAMLPTAQAGENPFSAVKMDNAYQLAQADTKGKDGKCGQGKCGGDKKADGKCGGDKKKDGKCGEGKCGGKK